MGDYIKMRFIISRTSDMFREGQPCKEAVKLPYTKIDERNVNDPKKIAFYGHAVTQQRA